MVAENVAKFGQTAELGNVLLGTNDRLIVEAATEDRVWGSGSSIRDTMVPVNQRRRRPEPSCATKKTDLVGGHGGACWSPRP